MRRAAGLFACMLMAGAMLPALAFAAPARPAEAFTISNYDVNAVISEDGSYDVAETIRVRFTEPRHGIVRTIPANGAFTVEGVGVDGFPFALSSDEKGMAVRIGNADSVVDGEQVYRLHYRLVNHAGAADEINFNIIGAEWDTTIAAVNFTVTLPKPVDADAVSFTIGRQGAERYREGDMKFTVDGALISGSTIKTIESYESLAMLVKLPQGYFQPVGPVEKPIVNSGGERVPVDAPINRPGGSAGGVPVGAATGLLAFIGFGVIAAGIVLAAVMSNRVSGAGPFRAGRAAPDPFMIDRQNQAINDMNAMNTMTPPVDPGTTGGSAGGSDSGAAGGGGGGSW